MIETHFILPYSGNNREEVETIHEYLKDKLEGIDTIIEPFCGTSAMSCYLSMKYPKRFKYILNDKNENMIELYHIMKSPDRFREFMDELNKTVKLVINKNAYLEVIKKGIFVAWFIRNKIYQLSSGCYRLNYKPKTNNFDNCGILQFLRTEDVEILCGDGVDIVKQHQNNTKTLIFLDPPYLMSVPVINTKILIYTGIVGFKTSTI
jgi:site-specific DNA-adenine methylase